MWTLTHLRTVRGILVFGIVQIALYVLSGEALAQDKIVLAPLSPLGINKSQVARVQRWIRAGLEQIPGYRCVATSRLEKLVIRSSMGHECYASSSCLGSLARKIGVSRVVSGDVGSLSGAYMIYLKLINNSGHSVRSASGVLDPNKPGLRKAVHGLATKLLSPRRYVGTLGIKVDVKNAWIYLNGQRLAQSPSPLLRNIPVGTHALRVTHEAYRDFVRFIKVDFGKRVDVKVRLSAFPVRASQMKLNARRRAPLSDLELPWYRRWWTVAGFGAVILAATTVTVAILAGRSISRDSEAVVRP